MNNKKTNVIILYVDDLGYGDLSCYGSEEISTPNIDRLCKEGLKFTDAYSTSAVCTPARYSLLTGEYPFRNNNASILPGNAACIISEDTYTMPKMFQKTGYRTGIVGKWHLGLSDGKNAINWNESINYTPNDVGFDYSFIFPATADRVPCVYLENRKILGLEENDKIEVSYDKECPFPDIPTAVKNPELLRMNYSHGHNQSIINGIGRIGYMRGGKNALWKDEDLADTFLSKAKEFISDSNDKPFFLYYAFHQPHVPRVPNPRFVGATKLGPRGDVIAEMDWCIGQLLGFLEENQLREDTIIIFSSDNGPVLDDGYEDKAFELNGEHRPAGPLRGGKYSKFEGGPRIPFLVSWKGTIQPGTSNALLSQVDLFASFANMLGEKLEDNDAPDSQNHLNVLLGETENGRTDLLAQTNSGGKTLRKGKWTYLMPEKGLSFSSSTQIETGISMDDQLYNLDYDIGQKHNVAYRYPHVVKEMKERTLEIVDSSKTRI